MARKQGGSEVWDEVIGRLSGPSLDKAKVTELVGLVAESLGADARRLKVFPKGIPWPDGIVIHTVADPKTLGSLVSLLQVSAHVDAFRVFPRGIINPEIFLTEIELS